MALDPPDPVKEAANLAKHHISLTRLDDMVDFDIIPDSQHSGAEPRFHAVGLIDGQLWTGVFTYRAGHRRPISLRRASRKERRMYAQAHKV